MSIRDFAQFLYGVMMGTSVPPLKQRERPLFPIRYQTFDPEVEIFIGGAGNGAIMTSGDQALVVNSNLGYAAQDLNQHFGKWYKKKTEDEGRVVAVNMIVQSLTQEYAGGAREFINRANLFYVNVGAFSREEEKERLGFFGIPESRAEFVMGPTDLQVGDLAIRLHPVDFVFGSEIVVEIPSRKMVFWGPLIYNHLHPVFRVSRYIRPRHWSEYLRKNFSDWKNYSHIPGEGEILTAAKMEDFADYLDTLSQPEVEFSECRRRFDWPEIPGFTSLEENFNLLQEAGRLESTSQ